MAVFGRYVCKVPCGLQILIANDELFSNFRKQPEPQVLGFQACPLPFAQNLPVGQPPL